MPKLDESIVQGVSGAEPAMHIALLSFALKRDAYEMRIRGML